MIGVPVSTHLDCASKAVAASADLVLGFLIVWPSSKITRRHSMENRPSFRGIGGGCFALRGAYSLDNAPYVVITISYVLRSSLDFLPEP